MANMKDSNMTPLAKLRIDAGFSREDAASLLNVVMMTLYRYETGKTDIPLGVAENMASLYRVPFNDLREAARNTKELKGVEAEGRINIGRQQRITRIINKSKSKEVALS